MKLATIFKQIITSTLAVLLLVGSALPQAVFAREAEVSVRSETKDSVVKEVTATESLIAEEALSETKELVESTQSAEANLFAEPLSGEDPLDEGENMAAMSSSIGGANLEVQPYKAPNSLELAATDETSGAFNYSYSFSSPDGRNGLNPGLGISYSSQNTAQDSIFGYGWSDNIPYIERLNKTGIEKLYTDDYFISSFGGELVNTSGATYKHRDESGSFLEYVFNGTHWIATDNQGNTYTFGLNSQSRQDDPNDPLRVFKWMLETLTDPNGNSIDYTYHKASGQIYPDVISYDVYELRFSRESRLDTMAQAHPGFFIINQQRVDGIELWVNGAQELEYDLHYVVGDNGRRSMLDSVSRQNGSSAIETTEFEYSVSTHNWTLEPNWQMDLVQTFVKANNSQSNVSFVNLNGDGYIDLMNPIYGNQYGNKSWLHNLDNRWSETNQWDAPFSYPNYNWWEVKIGDFNGDLYEDLVHPITRNAYLNDKTHSFVLGGASQHYPQPTINLSLRWSKTPTTTTKTVTSSMALTLVSSNTTTTTR